jgi:hypothetical protein
MQKQIAKQKGIVLIIFAIILVLATMAYLIKMFDPAVLQTARDEKNAQFLAQAKQALISYSVSRAAAGERPGDMPRPDYFPANEIPLGLDYDGTAETGCVEVSALNIPILPLNLITTGNIRCLGRLPWRTTGFSIPDSSQSDPSGTMPWYAVSVNLVDPGCAKLFNPKLVNLPYAGYVCNSDVATSYPWLTVRDSSGNILSNQVAAVLMLPDSILPGQTRTVAPLGGVTNYLDTVTVPIGCAAPCTPGAYSNADFDNDFIIPPPSNAPGSTSNDRLVYITLQELMRAVERRATQEAATQLKRYYTNSNAVAGNRFYPYAANLGDANNACVDTIKAGFLSVLPASANCTNASTCTTDFPLTTVDFSLASGLIFTSNSGSCSRSTGSCVCNGAGNCRRGAIRFTCAAAGAIFSCQSTGAGSGGTFSFTYTPKTPDVTVTSGACTGGAGTVNCVGGAGDFSSPYTNCTHANPGISTLPTWFTDNNWQEYIYYAISNNCSAASTGCAAANLTVGTHNNVHAVVVATGITLPTTQALAIPQVRPSASIADYLDSTENTNGDTIFDATSKMKANDYNDQSLIVAP